MTKLQKAIEVVQSMKGQLIGFAPEDPKFPDGYLYTVIAYFADKNEYTVWLYNSDFNGMYQGYYTNNYENALIEFKRRIDRF
jgi:hypothetical protein